MTIRSHPLRSATRMKCMCAASTVRSAARLVQFDMVPKTSLGALESFGGWQTRREIVPRAAIWRVAGDENFGMGSHTEFARYT